MARTRALPSTPTMARTPSTVLRPEHALTRLDGCHHRPPAPPVTQAETVSVGGLDQAGSGCRRQRSGLVSWVSANRVPPAGPHRSSIWHPWRSRPEKWRLVKDKSLSAVGFRDLAAPFQGLGLPWDASWSTPRRASGVRPLLAPGRTRAPGRRKRCLLDRPKPSALTVRVHRFSRCGERRALQGVRRGLRVQLDQIRGRC